MAPVAPLLTAALLAACGPKAAIPDLHGSAPGPVWPQQPDAPQVAWVGAIELPDEGLGRPMDVACGHSAVVIADAEHQIVYHVDLGSHRVRELVPRSGMRSPVGVFLGASGEVLVADSGTATVYRSPDGRARPAVLAQGAPMLRPTAVLAREGGGYLVVDAGAHCLHHLTEDGEVAGRTGERGRPGQGFNYPVDASWTGDGQLLVADGLNAVVQEVVEGAPRTLAGTPGVGGEGLVRPKGIAVDSLGRVHVVDGGMQHVQVYGLDGRLLGRYGHPGVGPGELALPAGLCISGDHAFVADSLNHRVAVYRLLEVDP